MEEVHPMSKWALYDELIAGIPDDVRVRDYGLGINWSWLDAECGCGISYTTRGGSMRPGRRDLRGKPLKQAAELAKSWYFEDATIGVAALNAWYSQRERIDALEGLQVKYAEGPKLRVDDEPFDEQRVSGKQKRDDDVDPFEVLRPQIKARGGDARVVVVGHFPHVEDIAEYADLTVLERNCRSEFDTPDPACEYIIPDADYVFLTGVTLMNKTAPRLIELARNAKTIMVGPSAVPAAALLDNGVDIMGGRVVEDPEKVSFCCATREAFGDALRSFILMPA